MKRPAFAWSITVLALLGMALSAVSIKNHYSTEDTGYCAFDETFNCDLVNRSIYSRIFGVPVAVVGFVGYALLLALAWLRRRRRLFAWVMLAGAVAGLAFSIYLTYIEAYVLAVWCILCLASLAIIFVITVLAAAGLARRNAAPA